MRRRGGCRRPSPASIPFVRRRHDRFTLDGRAASSIGTLTQVEYGPFDLTRYMAPGIGEQSSLFNTVPMNEDKTVIISR